MASLTDIPAELLTPERKADFIQWLVRQDIQYGPRRRLASLWRNATGANITPDEWRIIQAKP